MPSEPGSPKRWHVLLLLAKRQGGESTEAGVAGAAIIEVHHLLPRQFATQFERAGLDIEQYTLKMPREAHRLKPDELHARGPNGWNQAWAKFFERNPAASRKDILEELDKMMREFGVR